MSMLRDWPLDTAEALGITIITRVNRRLRDYTLWKFVTIRDKEEHTSDGKIYKNVM